jgi:hypothetical protein
MSIIDKFADLFYPNTNVLCESIENIDPNAARIIADKYNTQTVKDSDMVGIYDAIKKESSLGGNYINMISIIKSNDKLGKQLPIVLDTKVIGQIIFMDLRLML